jgi:hypothetical protein
MVLLNPLQKELDERQCCIKHIVSYLTGEDPLIKFLSERNIMSALHSICSTKEYGQEMDFRQMGYEGGALSSEETEKGQTNIPEIKLPG